MNSFLLFLRGINVGGSKKILMKDLTDLLESLGFFNVKTYIQSGNVWLDIKGTYSLIQRVRPLDRKSYL